MRILSYLNPFSDRFNACNDFAHLGAGKRALTIIATALASLFTFGIGGVAVFRALVNRFTKLETKGSKPHEKTGKKTDKAAQKKLGAAKPEKSSPDQSATLPFHAQQYIASLERKAKSNLGERSLKMRSYMTERLAASGKKFIETKDDGDCMFDAIAQKLSILEKKPITVKDVRMACYHYIQELESVESGENWIKKSIASHPFYEYETFKDSIRYTTEEAIEAGLGAPLWGDALCSRIISAAYNVKIVSHSLHAYEIDTRSEDYADQLAIAGQQGRLVRVYTKYVELEECDLSSASQSAKGSEEDCPASAESPDTDDSGSYTEEESEYLSDDVYHEFMQDLDDEEYAAAFETQPATVGIDAAEVMTILDLDKGTVFDQRSMKAEDGRMVEIASYQSGASGHILAVVNSDF